MAKKAKIDKDLCISCGVCNAICPNVFDWDDDGKMKVIADPVPAEDEEAAVEAESSCPTGAISIQ